MPETYQIFQGDTGMWGVEIEGCGLVYEADMSRITAEAIVDMYKSEKPPRDWEEARARLDAAGLPY